MKKSPKTTKNKGLLPLRHRPRPEKLVLPLADAGQKAPDAKIFAGLKIDYLPIGDLVPAPDNPRHHPEKQIRQLAKSMMKFGCIIPILIDGFNNVIVGHGRLEGCKRANYTLVPTILIEHLTSAEVKLFRIADNRLAENSRWDEQFLSMNLKELLFLDPGIDLTVTGCSTGELDLIIMDTEEDDTDEEDIGYLKKTPESAVTRPGDLWLFGSNRMPHRVFCGNALKEEDYAVLMDGKLAVLVFGDIPYNLAIPGVVSGLGAHKHRNFAMASGEMSSQEFLQFLIDSGHLMARHSADGSIHYICIDWRNVGLLHAAGTTVYDELKNICVWVKSNAGMGSLYRGQHEFIFVFKHGKAPHKNNVELGRHGRNRSNVWRYPGIQAYRNAGPEGDLLALHPTVKPLNMVADAILDCSDRGDIVLDSFLGSGTTLLAAEKTGRVCYGLELDPLYVDVIIRRWQARTGLQPILAATGQTFAAIAAERAALAQEVDYDA